MAPVALVVADIVVPIAIFFGLRAFDVDTIPALVVGTSASVVLTMISSIRRRRVEGISLLVLLVFVVGLTVTFLTDDPRILLIKPSILFVAIAGYLLVSCRVGQPAMYSFLEPVATGGDPEKLERYEATWREVPDFRRLLRQMTALWGMTWLVESVVRIGIVWAFPPERVGVALLWTIVALVALLVLAVALTIWLGRRLRRVGEAFDAEWADRRRDSAHRE